jgi:hypothetical protein
MQHFMQPLIDPISNIPDFPQVTHDKIQIPNNVPTDYKEIWSDFSEILRVAKELTNIERIRMMLILVFRYDLRERLRYSIAASFIHLVRSLYQRLDPVTVFLLGGLFKILTDTTAIVWHIMGGIFHNEWVQKILAGWEVAGTGAYYGTKMFKDAGRILGFRFSEASWIPLVPSRIVQKFIDWGVGARNNLLEQVKIYLPPDSITDWESKTFLQILAPFQSLKSLFIPSSPDSAFYKIISGDSGSWIFRAMKFVTVELGVQTISLVSQATVTGLIRQLVNSFWDFIPAGGVTRWIVGHTVGGANAKSDLSDLLGADHLLGVITYYWVQNLLRNITHLWGYKNKGLLFRFFMSGLTSNFLSTAAFTMDVISWGRGFLSSLLSSPATIVEADLHDRDLLTFVTEMGNQYTTAIDRRGIIDPETGSISSKDLTVAMANAVTYLSIQQNSAQRLILSPDQIRSQWLPRLGAVLTNNMEDVKSLEFLCTNEKLSELCQATLRTTTKEEMTKMLQTAYDEGKKITKARKSGQIPYTRRKYGILTTAFVAVGYFLLAQLESLPPNSIQGYDFERGVNVELNEQFSVKLDQSIYSNVVDMKPLKDVYKNLIFEGEDKYINTSRIQDYMDYQISTPELTKPGFFTSFWSGVKKLWRGDMQSDDNTFLKYYPQDRSNLEVCVFAKETFNLTEALMTITPDRVEDHITYQFFRQRDGVPSTTMKSIRDSVYLPAEVTIPPYIPPTVPVNPISYETANLERYSAFQVPSRNSLAIIQSGNRIPGGTYINQYQQNMTNPRNLLADVHLSRQSETKNREDIQILKLQLELEMKETLQKQETNEREQAEYLRQFKKQRGIQHRSKIIAPPPKVIRRSVKRTLETEESFAAKIQRELEIARQQQLAARIRFEQLQKSRHGRLQQKSKVVQRVIQRTVRKQKQSPLQRSREDFDEIVRKNLPRIYPDPGVVDEPLRKTTQEAFHQIVRNHFNALYKDPNRFKAVREGRIPDLFHETDRQLLIHYLGAYQGTPHVRIKQELEKRLPEELLELPEVLFSVTFDPTLLGELWSLTNPLPGGFLLSTPPPDSGIPQESWNFITQYLHIQPFGRYFRPTSDSPYYIEVEEYNVNGMVHLKIPDTNLVIRSIPESMNQLWRNNFEPTLSQLL